MKQHFEKVDADVIGLSEVDTKSDSQVEAHLGLLAMMKGLGYANQIFEKANHKTASAVFYKKDKFNCLQAEQKAFKPGGSQFFMYCVLCLKSDDSFKFVFGETHLVAKPPKM